MKDTSFSVVLHHPSAMPGQARAALTRQLLPHVEAMFARGIDRVRVTAEEDDDAITAEQRGYLHGVVMTEIALYARDAEGRQYPMATWKEYFRGRLLPDKVRTFRNPITGRKSRRRVRVSTEDLGVRRLAQYIDEVIAIAATELGVVISEPVPAHLRAEQRRKAAVLNNRIDAETGELEHA